MATGYLGALRRFDRSVHLYFISSALIGFSFMGLFRVLFNLYMLRLGYGPEFIGLTSAAALFSYAAFSLPAGALGTRWGSRRVLALGLFLHAAGLGLAAMAELVPLSIQPGWLISTRVLASFGLGIYFVNGGPFLAELTGPGERGHAFSLQLALLPLFGSAGSLAGGFLPRWFGELLGVSVDHAAPYRLALLVAAAGLLPAGFAMLAIRGERSAGSRAGAATRGPAPYGIIGLMAGVMLLRFAGQAPVDAFFNVYLDAGLDVPPSQIGLLMGITQLTIVPAALVTPLLMARWGRERGFVWGTLVMAATLVPLALIPHWGAAGAALLVYSAANNISYTAATVYQMEAVSPGWRATMSAASVAAGGLGMSVVAFGGGRMIVTLGYGSVFLAGALLAAFSALLFWGWFRVPRRARAGPPAVDLSISPEG